MIKIKAPELKSKEVPFHTFDAASCTSPEVSFEPACKVVLSSVHILKPSHGLGFFDCMDISIS
jgi:hypothetical protein